MNNLAFCIQEQQSCRNFEKMVSHYDNSPMQYTADFYGCRNDNFQMKNCYIFLNFAQNIDCWHTLEPPCEAVLTSTHDLYFRAKIRKNVYPYILYKSGV